MFTSFKEVMLCSFLLRLHASVTMHVKYSRCSDIADVQSFFFKVYRGETSLSLLAQGSLNELMSSLNLHEQDA